MNYNINLAVNYEHFDIFKQKNMLILQALIGGARVGEIIKFNSYGIITPTEHKNNNIDIECSDKYNRLKTNCLVYDVIDLSKTYDKLFIYYEVMSRDTTWYSYILYNTTTGKMHHEYYLPYMDDKLCQYIYKSIRKIKEAKKWEFYIKKMITTKYKRIKDIPTLADYNEMQEYYS